MRPVDRSVLLAGVLAAALAASGFASPRSSRLLCLVPPGAEVVSGFENRADPGGHGRLVLATRNNRLDLDDFQALTGSDPLRAFEEVIEVAASPDEGALSEHMLLTAGRFDRERIFRSIEENGAKNLKFLGETILLVEPFARERGDMLDTRWFVILDHHIGIFGTPWLVQKALRRYADRALPDPVLEQRLALLRPDVTSWNVLVNSRENFTKFTFAKPHTAWAQLQEDADVLMVAAHFGTKIRVDFSIHADAGRGAEFFTRKADIFTDAVGTSPSAEGTSRNAQRRLRNFTLDANRVQGSVEMSSGQFDDWCNRLYLARAGIAPPTSNGD